MQTPGRVSAPSFEELYRDDPHLADLIRLAWMEGHGDEWEDAFNAKQVTIMQTYGSKKRWLQAENEIRGRRQSRTPPHS